MIQCIVIDSSSKQKGKAAKSRKGVKRPLDSTEKDVATDQEALRSSKTTATLHTAKVYIRVAVCMHM